MLQPRFFVAPTQKIESRHLRAHSVGGSIVLFTVFSAPAAHGFPHTLCQKLRMQPHMLIYVIFVSSEQIHIDLQFALKNRDLILFSRSKDPFPVFLEILIRLHLRRQPHLQLPILSRAEFLRNIDPYLLNCSSGLIDDYQPEFLLIFPRVILNKIIALVELLRIENINELAGLRRVPSHI